MQLILICSAVIANIIIVNIIYFKSARLTSYDKILMNHCFIQGFTALVDVPFFHINAMFGFFPCGRVLGLLWAIYDNNINMTTNFNMLYMCWVRWRCIAAPKSFNSEFIIRKPITMCCLIWACGLGTWTIISTRFGIMPDTFAVQFNPSFLKNILNIFFWLTPLLLISILSVFIFVRLNKASKNKKALAKNKTLENTTTHKSSTLSKTSHKKKKEASMTPHIRFLTLIIIYQIQWYIPCLLVIVDGSCNCVSPDVLTSIYWLTYSVLLTDPIFIYILSPNLKIKIRNIQ
jgi:hypothetical protein